MISAFGIEHGEVFKARSKTERQKRAGAGAFAAGSGMLYAGFKAKPAEAFTNEVKGAMKQAAQTNFEGYRGMGYGKLRSKVKTARAQVKANPGNIPNFKFRTDTNFGPTGSGKFDGNWSLHRAEFAEDQRVKGEQRKMALRSIKNYGGKFHASRGLRRAGVVTAAAGLASYKAAESKKK